MTPSVVVANTASNNNSNPQSPYFVEAAPAGPGNVQHQEVYPAHVVNQYPTASYGYPVNSAYPPGTVPVSIQPNGAMLQPNQQNLE